MTDARHYHSYTEENVSNAVAAVNNGMSKNLAAVTFQVPRSAIVFKCLGRHSESMDRPTILTHGDFIDIYRFYRLSISETRKTTCHFLIQIIAFMCCFHRLVLFYFIMVV